MPTIASSAHLTIAAGATPPGIVISVHGRLDAAAAASLEEVLHRLLDHGDIAALGIDLHDVRGVDLSGVSRLATLAVQVGQRHAHLTLIDPQELMCEALEAQDLTGIIRMGGCDASAARLANGADRRRARRQHPAGHLLRP